MILSFVLSLNGNFLQLWGLGHTSHIVAIGDGISTALLPRVKPSWQCVQGSFLLRREEQFLRDPVQSGLIICFKVLLAVMVNCCLSCRLMSMIYLCKHLLLGFRDER